VQITETLHIAHDSFSITGLSMGLQLRERLPGQEPLDTTAEELTEMVDRWLEDGVIKVAFSSLDDVVLKGVLVWNDLETSLLFTSRGSPVQPYYGAEGSPPKPSIHLDRLGLILLNGGNPFLDCSRQLRLADSMIDRLFSGLGIPRLDKQPESERLTGQRSS
jgi:hypothetical protein